MARTTPELEKQLRELDKKFPTIKEEKEKEKKDAERTEQKN